MAKPTQVNAAALIIGDEILSGRTQDQNIAYLAQKLGEAGIQLKEVRVVPDDKEEIIEAVNALRAKYGYLFTTGGIGPTHDDITTESVAAALGVAVARNEKAHALLKAHYSAEQLNEARLKMADIAVGATLIENPISMSPGWQLENVYVLAGVPEIMKAMLDLILPSLSGGDIKHSATVSSLKTEGEIADDLTAVVAKFPEVDIGSYPYFKNGRFGVSLVLRSFDKEKLDQACAHLKSVIE